MVNGYDDLHDLVQNQRALAKMVSDIGTDHENLKETVEFIEDVKNNVANLQTEIDTKFGDFSTQITNKSNEVDSLIAAANQKLSKLTTDYNNLSQILTDANGNPHDMVELINIMTSIQTTIGGYTDPSTGDYHPGLQKHVEALMERAKHIPTIVIMPEGTNIPEEERYDDCLYGTITDEVREIETGKAVRLGPNIQGVIQGNDEEIKEV